MFVDSVIVPHHEWTVKFPLECFLLDNTASLPMKEPPWNTHYLSPGGMFTSGTSLSLYGTNCQDLTRLYRKDPSRASPPQVSLQIHGLLLF
jgi:hypothetical protein